MKNQIKDGFKAGLPICIGYLPVAVAFGILAKTTGITLLEAFLFSAVVFAGASQFMALNLLATGVGFSGIILTTLLVNFRHFIMSSYIASRVDNGMKRSFPLIAFGVTDESFSVLSFKKGELSRNFIIVLEGVAYISWVTGTISGYILGGFLPALLVKSMGIALYAMFVALLMPEVKKSYRAFILALSAGVLNSFLIYLDLLPKGWSIIVTIILVSAIGTFFYEGGDAI